MAKRIREFRIKIAEYQKVRWKLSVLRTRLSNFKGIPHTPVGLNEFFFEVAVDLIA